MLLIVKSKHCWFEQVCDKQNPMTNLWRTWAGPQSRRAELWRRWQPYCRLWQWRDCRSPPDLSTGRWSDGPLKLYQACHAPFPGHNQPISTPNVTLSSLSLFLLLKTKTKWYYTDHPALSFVFLSSPSAVCYSFDCCELYFPISRSESVHKITILSFYKVKSSIHRQSSCQLSNCQIMATQRRGGGGGGGRRGLWTGVNVCQIHNPTASTGSICHNSQNPPSPFSTKCAQSKTSQLSNCPSRSEN